MDPAPVVAASAEPDDVYSMQAKITSQQSVIKLLKKSGTASAQAIADGVAILLELRASLAEMQKTTDPVEVFNRKSFDELILRKMYVVPSFEIHNGPAGLFDYGPPACALKSNVLALWRQHFALEENMLEMECTNLTPSVVLETSGHVERFTDFMVKDEKTSECFRADKLLEDAIDKLLDSNPTMPVEEQEAHRIIQVMTMYWSDNFSKLSCFFCLLLRPTPTIIYLLFSEASGRFYCRRIARHA